MFIESFIVSSHHLLIVSFIAPFIAHSSPSVLGLAIAHPRLTQVGLSALLELGLYLFIHHSTFYI